MKRKCEEEEECLVRIATKARIFSARFSPRISTGAQSEQLLFPTQFNSRFTFQAVYEVGSVPGCSPYIRLVSGVGGD